MDCYIMIAVKENNESRGPPRYLELGTLQYHHYHHHFLHVPPASLVAPSLFDPPQCMMAGGGPMGDDGRSRNDGFRRKITVNE